MCPMRRAGNPTSAEIASYYDDFSTRLLSDYVVGNRRIEAQCSFLREAIAPTAKRIIVIGCGSGQSAYFMARRVARRASIVGTDISPVNIRIARLLFPHKRIEYRHADILQERLDGVWEVVVLPDVYEHIRTSDRTKLHANINPALGERGRILITVPSPGHQQFLRERGDGLQIVDETVTLDDLRMMADELRASLTFFSMVSVFRTNDYIHAVIERGADRVRPIIARDRLPIKRQVPWFRTQWNRWVARSGKLTRPWRALRVARRLGRLRMQTFPHDHADRPGRQEDDA